MADGKRYYWLKLQDGFFSSKRIKKLRKIAGGDTYTIIYLKMQLLAMKNEGVLEYTGLESTFAEELALDLDEEPENVAVTVNYLLSCGLMETDDDKEYFIPYSILNTGSESASAKRVRDHRERKALQCNTDVTEVKQLGNGEKETEIETDTEIKKNTKKKPSKSKYGDNQNVLLTDNEFENLAKSFGAELRDKAISFLDAYIEEKGYKSKSHNLTIRRWVIDAVKEKQPKGRKEAVPDWVEKDDVSWMKKYANNKKPDPALEERIKRLKRDIGV